MSATERNRAAWPFKYKQARTAGADAAVRRTLASGGRPLEGQARASMEQQFGHDFSRVRVHTDAYAAESAGMVGARAYTVGQDIVFAQGAFNPGVEEGRTLLAHELAHTVQL